MLPQRRTAVIKEDLDKLSTEDIYSLVLFAILQLKTSPEYAVLSELIYSLDRDSLLNLCKQFGGITITIPTLDELNAVIDALLLYVYVNLEHKPVEYGLALLDVDAQTSKEVIKIYSKINDVISGFDFRRTCSV